MKKILALILAALLIMSAGTIGVFAAKGSFGKGFTDADEDGICDNAVNPSSFIDENADGICDNRKNNLCSQPQKPEKGKGFADADEDGVCDNFDACNGQSEERRQCKGNGQGKGLGRGFTDADGDGSCDNRGICRRGR